MAPSKVDEVGGAGVGMAAVAAVVVRRREGRRRGPVGRKGAARGGSGVGVGAGAEGVAFGRTRWESREVAVVLGVLVMALLALGVGAAGDDRRRAAIISCACAFRERRREVCVWSCPLARARAGEKGNADHARSGEGGMCVWSEYACVCVRVKVKERALN
jgi:hypothetical protein